MKTQCLQTNEMQHYWKGKYLRSKRWSRERVALIKSLIYARCKETCLRRGCQIELNLSADMYVCEREREREKTRKNRQRKNRRER